MKLRQTFKIGSGSFGVAYKAKFNGKHLRSERPAEIALFCRLVNNLHHEIIVQIQGCNFSICALMLSYQCFDISPFGIEKKVNNLL